MSIVETPAAELASPPISKPQGEGGLLGPLLCLASAIFYAGTNIALRRLADPARPADPVWTLCVKEFITVLIVGPWLVWALWTRKIPLVTWRSFLAILSAGIPTQVVGNLGMLWVLGVVGIAIAVPVSLAVMLISAALLGRLFLRERLSLHTIIAMFLLVMGIAILQYGAHGSLGSITGWQSTIAIGLCCLAGIVFGYLSVVIRGVTTRGTSGWFVLVLVTGCGVVTMGPLTLARHGLEVFSTTLPEHWFLMVLSGLLNLLGFFCLTKGLQLTPVARANLLSSSQAAFAAMAGWVFFGEVLNLPVAIGLILTLVTIVLTSLH